MIQLLEHVAYVALFIQLPKLIDANDDNKLTSNQVGTFQNYFRLSNECHLVLSKVELKIKELDIHYKRAITAKERLMVTLRYFATSASLSQQHYEWYISVARKKNPETSKAIYNCFKI